MFLIMIMPQVYCKSSIQVWYFDTIASDYYENHFSIQRYLIVSIHV